MKYLQVAKIQQETKKPYADIYISNGDVFKEMDLQGARTLDVLGPSSKEPETLRLTKNGNELYIDLSSIEAVYCYDKEKGAK